MSEFVVSLRPIAAAIGSVMLGFHFGWDVGFCAFLFAFSVAPESRS